MESILLSQRWPANDSVAMNAASKRTDICNEARRMLGNTIVPFD